MDCGFAGVAPDRTVLPVVCEFSLTYIYINLSWRYRKWEMEQREKQALEEQQQPKKSKKSRVWDKSESKKQK